MGKTVKFTISVPAGEFKDLEAARRKAGKTRSQFVRDRVRAAEGEAERRQAAAYIEIPSLKEESARYGPPGSEIPALTDTEELRRRAIAAAGRFRSGVTDLSAAHDKYIEGEFAAAEEKP